MADEIKNISKDILELAPTVRRTILESFWMTRESRIENGLNISYTRGIQDVALDIDHKIGKLYISEIYQKYSSLLTIDSEEAEERIGKGKITLRLDPVDGSKHLLVGFPEVASTASLVVDGIVYFGMVINVFADDVYSANEGGGAYLNGIRIHVNDRKIDDDYSVVNYESPTPVLLDKDPKKMDENSKKYTLLNKSSYRTRNIGISSNAICLVANGASTAYVDLSGSTKLYDVEAAMLIANEAGAVLGFIDGEKVVEGMKSWGDKKLLEGNLIVANKKAFGQIKRLFVVN